MTQPGQGQSQSVEHLLRDLTPQVLGALLRLNAIHHLLYCQYRDPRYGRLVHRVGRCLERLTAGRRGQIA